MQLPDINTKFLGKNVIHYQKIDSTQLEVWRKVKQNAENGLLVVTETQLQGKGTHGRSWYTGKDKNIAFSFYIKANCNIKKIEGITIEIAETIVEVFQESYNITLQIKHPNDIIFQGKKIGGILTETKLNGDIVKDIVVGIGINTNQETFPQDLQDIASSIKKEFGIIVDNEKIISKFCNKFEEKIIKRIG